MSKPKGLEFQASEPAFLRRMRGEIAGNVDDPDRQINPVARPKVAKRLENDDDDAPMYVLEDGSATLTKEEYDALLKEPSLEEKSASAETKKREMAEEAPRSKQKLAEIGTLKKRKAAKVVGADEDDSKDSVLGKAIGNASSKAKIDGKKTPKKKKAKVNINFDDDDQNT